ncbi:unnamed protein product [Chrysoparadoxa australica]
MICQNYPLYEYERGDGCYGVSEWLYHLVLLQLTHGTYMTGMSACIQYFIGLQKIWSWSNFVTLMTLSAAHSQVYLAYFTLCSLLAKGSKSWGVAMGSIAQVFSNFFAGFMVPLATMPRLFRVCHHFSPTYYAFSVMVVALMSDMMFDCNGSILTCIDKSGKFVIDYLGYGDTHLSPNLGILWLGWLSLTYASLLVLTAPWEPRQVILIDRAPPQFQRRMSVTLQQGKQALKSKLSAQLKRARSLSPSAMLRQTSINIGKILPSTKGSGDKVRGRQLPSELQIDIQSPMHPANGHSGSSQEEFPPLLAGASTSAVEGGSTTAMSCSPATEGFWARSPSSVDLLSNSVISPLSTPGTNLDEKALANEKAHGNVVEKLSKSSMFKAPSIDTSMMATGKSARRRSRSKSKPRPAKGQGGGASTTPRGDAMTAFMDKESMIAAKRLGARRKMLTRSRDLRKDEDDDENLTGLVVNMAQRIRTWKRC